MSGTDEPGGFYVSPDPQTPQSPGQQLDAALELEEQTVEAFSAAVERLRAELAALTVQLAEVQAGYAWLQRRIRRAEEALGLE